jgi:hypothetical protein
MKCIPFYCNIAHEQKGRGMKNKLIWVSYMIKFIIRATWVSKYFRLKRWTHSCQNGVRSRGIPQAYFARRRSRRHAIPTRRSPYTFPHGSDGLLKSQVSREMDWQGRAYHLATSFAWPHSPWFFFLGYIKDAVYMPPLATTLPELDGRRRDAESTVTLGGLKVNTVMISAWPLTMPSSNTCKM